MLTRKEIEALLEALERWVAEAANATGITDPRGPSGQGAVTRRWRARREAATIIGAKLLGMRDAAKSV